MRLTNLLNTTQRLINKYSLTWWYVFKTSWRCLSDVFARRLENVLKASWKRLEDVMARRLEDVWTRRIYWSWPRRLEDVLKTSSEDVWLIRIYSSSSRCLEDVFWRRRRKTSSRRLHIYWVVCPPFLVTFKILIDKCTTIHYFEDNSIFNHELSFPSPLMLKIIEKKVCNFELQF